MPSLRTSLCMVSGPGALPLLRNLTNLMCLGINIGHKLVLISHVKPVVIWVIRGIKILIIILDEFVDLIEVVRIKMVALDAKVPFDRFSKELRFVGVGLGDFVSMLQSRIIALTLRLNPILDGVRAHPILDGGESPLG